MLTPLHPSPTYRSFNALALEKESLRTAISNAQKEVESMSARTEGLGADVEHTRAEKATLAGHNLMLEQDLAAARGQATTCSNAHAEEKRVVESLRVELATEVEYALLANLRVRVLA